MAEATLNEPVRTELTLLNPLPEPLLDCSFTIEGVGLTDGKPITAKYAIQQFFYAVFVSFKSD